MISSHPGASATSVRSGGLASRMTLRESRAAWQGENIGTGAAEIRFGVCGGVELTKGADAGSTGIGDFRF